MMTHTTQTFKNRAGKEKKIEIGTAQAKQFAYGAVCTLQSPKCEICVAKKHCRRG